MAYRRVASLKTAEDLAAYLAQSHIDLAFDPEVESGPSSPLIASPPQFVTYCIVNGYEDWLSLTTPPSHPRRQKLLSEHPPRRRHRNWAFARPAPQSDTAVESGRAPDLVQAENRLR